MASEAATCNALRTRFTLVLGGARSGKSGFAQALAERSGRRLIYCATAQDWDDSEMRARIARHQAERDARWRTVEAPRHLAAAIGEAASPDAVVLVDCLTLWLSTVLLDGADVDAACADLVDAIPGLPGPAIFVSNEVGWGIVPDNPLGRRFRDAQGRLNQAMAAVCDTVVMVAAGLPLVLKPCYAPILQVG